MTTVNPTSSSSAATQQSALSSLTSNFETFLTLLTTEMQNQDPTNPTDTSQYISQISQMAMVQAQIENNDKLDALITQGANNANSTALSYLGKSVTMTDGTGVLSEGSGTWYYGLGSASATTTLTITNANGDTVYTADGETTTGTKSFVWDGKDADGNQLSDGTYTLTVTAKDANGNKVTTSVASKVTVSGVDLSGSSPMLVVGNIEVPLSSATLISE